MKKNKFVYFAATLLVLSMAFVSCSENVNDNEEYANWQNVNDAAFNDSINLAQQRISAGDTLYKIYNVWSINDTIKTANTNKIVVHVINSGKGSGCPLYTDSVKVHYSGRLLPSASYPKGKVFDQSWQGEYNLQTNRARVMAVNTLTDGFATALQHMHIGDRWLVTVPYNLGYGTTGYTSAGIPAYSALVFDITLVAYSRVGTALPINVMSKSTQWVEK